MTPKMEVICQLPLREGKEYAAWDLINQVEVLLRYSITVHRDTNGNHIKYTLHIQQNHIETEKNFPNTEQVIDHIKSYYSVWNNT